MNMKELLYGAAYYDEYMPYDRLDKDVEMMKKAGNQYRSNCRVYPEHLRAAAGVFCFPMWKE